MRRHLLFALLFTLIFTGVFAPFDMANYPHEGVVLKSAIDMAEGKMLFRDSFTQYGPVPVLLTALVITFFGKYVIVPKILAVLVYGLIACFLWLIASRFLSRRQSTLSVIVWNLLTHHYFQPFLPWPSIYVLLFQTLCVYAVFRFFESNNRLWIISAGAAIALSFLSKQNGGIFLLLSQVLFFAVLTRTEGVSYRKALTALLKGFFGVMALFWIWLIANGALAEWWKDSIVFGVGMGGAYGGSYGLGSILSPLLLLRQDDPYGDYMFLLLPLACALLLAVYLFRAFRSGLNQTQIKVSALLITCLGSWGQYYPVPAGCYFWWASALMAAPFLKVLNDCVSFCAAKMRMTSSLVRTGIFLSLLVLLMAYPLQKRFDALYERLKKDYVFMDSTKSLFFGIFLPPDRADFAEQVENAINLIVNDRYKNPYVVLDNSGSLYLCMVKNARHFHPMWAWHQIYWRMYPEFQGQVNEFIREKKPVVFLRPEQFPRYRIKYPDTFRVMTTDYTVAARINDEFMILAPKEKPVWD